jgi:UDP-glucose 4-epimerase
VRGRSRAPPRCGIVAASRSRRARLPSCRAGAPRLAWALAGAPVAASSGHRDHRRAIAPRARHRDPRRAIPIPAAPSLSQRAIATSAAPPRGTVRHMRVLVTGGAGYIGSISVEALSAAGHVPVVLDDLSTGHAGSVPQEVPLHRGDCTDQALVAGILTDERIDAVLHCAARSLVGESMQDPARYFRQNVAGGVALLEAIRLTGVRRVVFSSSAAVYGVPDGVPIDEDAPLRPINPYGESKRIFETALTWYAHGHGLRTVSLRYFNAAGASERCGEVHDPETHLIPNILKAAEGRTELTLFGSDFDTPDGTAIRDYIHVEDLARAHVLALEATAPDDPRTGADPHAGGSLVCNLGTGHGYSVLEVHRAAEEAVGRPIPATMGPRRPGDPPALVAAAGRAARVLDWRPQRSDLASMIGSAWAWRQAHPDGYAD